MMRKRKENMRARLKLEYEVIVKDKDGKVIHREKRVSKSLVIAFTQWLRSKFTITDRGGDATAFTMIDTGNVSRTLPFPHSGVPAEGYWGHFSALVNISVKGVVVGSGTTTVTAIDYALATQIAHGVGSGQLNYGAHTIEAVDVVGLASRFRWTRTFTNNSGSSVTVNEIGIYFDTTDSAGTERYFCACRDKLASPTSVPDGATLTVRYRFSVTA